MPLDKPFHLYLLCIYTMKQYNFYNLEASFIRFLNSGNRDLSKVTIKNYISDLRHFFGWFIFRLKASQDYTHYVEKLDSSFNYTVPRQTNCLTIQSLFNCK